MTLSRLYCNSPEVFKPISFKRGLNAVVAEIRLPENRRKDTHNLGKSTLGQLIDFCLLRQRNKRFFLFRHLDRFEDFVFFLEMELGDGSFVTVRRAVSEPSKGSFKLHEAGNQDYSNLPPDEWDHYRVTFERSRDLLDSYLDWSALSPWSYRKFVGYLVRSQDDFQDVVQLKKFASAHSDWKPFLAHVLGFDAELVARLYQIESDLEEKEESAAVLRTELGGSVEDANKIEGLLLLKQEEVEKLQSYLTDFDFRVPDAENTRKLVDDVDVRISELNVRRYSLRHSLRKVVSSLEEHHILFDPDEAETLFEDAGVAFPDQIKRDFEQLIEFNRAITAERRQYLEDERRDLQAALAEIESELDELGKRRSTLLRFLKDSDAFQKYRDVSGDLVQLRADIEVLARQRAWVRKLQELRSGIRRLKEEREHVQEAVEKDVEAQAVDRESRFSKIRLYFNEVVEEVIDQKALFTVSTNRLGHLEFNVDILDDAGKATSAGLGFTYRKLLCIAFDLAILRAYLDAPFPRFVFHDGVFESLDNRKKLNLLSVLRDHAAMGLQPVITLIDSDLPSRPAEVLGPDELLLVLHDEGDEGRLFKMAPW